MSPTQATKNDSWLKEIGVIPRRSEDSDLKTNRRKSWNIRGKPRRKSKYVWRKTIHQAENELASDQLLKQNNNYLQVEQKPKSKLQELEEEKEPSLKELIKGKDLYHYHNIHYYYDDH